MLSRTTYEASDRRCTPCSDPLQRGGDPGTVRPPGSNTPFRAAVDVVTVNVTVTDSARRMVSDLAREEFVVFEDNRPQTVTLFQKVGVPLAVSLLLDSSASMQDNLATAQEAASGFVNELGPEDTASIVDFDSRVEVMQGFTSDHSALERAIRRARAGWRHGSLQRVVHRVERTEQGGRC